VKSQKRNSRWGHSCKKEGSSSRETMFLFYAKDKRHGILGGVTKGRNWEQERDLVPEVWGDQGGVHNKKKVKGRRLEPSLFYVSTVGEREAFQEVKGGGF